MQHARIWRSLALTLATVSCQAITHTDDNQANQLEPSSELYQPWQPKPSTGYYQIHQDSSDCLHGFYVALLNEATTPCADGTNAKECYVRSLTLPENIPWNPGDVVHGVLQDVSTAGELLHVLVADAVLEPVGSKPDNKKGEYLFVQNTTCQPGVCEPTHLYRTLNKDEFDTTVHVLSFTAIDEDTRAAMSDSLNAEFSTTLEFGMGAISFGTHVFVPEEGRTKVELSRVYKTKLPPPPACVVVSMPQLLSAWQLKTLEAANTFARDIAGAIVFDQSCDYVEWACETTYDAVSGTINAWGDDCEDFQDRCEFERHVINAAGWAGSAAGAWQEGQCVGQLQGCLDDIECPANEFCGFGDYETVCLPRSGLGEPCYDPWEPYGPQRCLSQYECKRAEDGVGGVCAAP